MVSDLRCATRKSIMDYFSTGFYVFLLFDEKRFNG